VYIVRPEPGGQLMLRLGWRLMGCVVALSAVFGAARAVAGDRPQTAALGASQPKIEAALANILVLERPGQDGLATVWDGNKYVQCLRLPNRALRCEAAGALMQPSLAHILVPERVKQMEALGWRLDPHFGNYAQIFPSALPVNRATASIMRTLGEIYGADLDHLEAHTDWIASEPCPPRNGPSQNLAGMIDDTPSMAATAVHACAYVSDPANEAGAAALSTLNLINLYGARVSGEIQRLRVNAEREVFFVLNTDAGYIQCQPDTATKTIYCEAASAGEWPVLASVLTPERLARLHAAGYADPGRAPNYSKSYPAEALDEAALARELLTLLHDVYGYGGSPVLEISTEKGE
jgi:hypothetical protein